MVPKKTSLLLRWYRRHARPLPWRLTRDPWAVLVSEVMLQQTTVASVLANNRFEKFLREFPDLQAIARAPEQQLLKAWEGLGYYARARNLRKTARALLENHRGRFPRTAAELEALPGIGPYTAAALASIAFADPVPAIDANAVRVLARLHNHRQPVHTAGARKKIRAWAEQLLHPGHPGDSNSALMELGQTTCTLKNPACPRCPLKNHCLSKDKNPQALPKKKPRPKATPLQEHALLALKGAGKNKHLLLAREEGSRRRGLWRLPLRGADDLAHLSPALATRYAITRYRVTLRAYRIPPGDIPGGTRENESWHPLENLPRLPLATPHRRALDAFL